MTADRQEVRLAARFGPAEASLIALHCSEPSAQAAINELLTTLDGGVGIERVAIPGGCWWAARAAASGEGRLRGWLTSRMAGTAFDAVRGTLRRRGLDGVLLAGHQGCNWYRRLHPGATEGELVRLQGEDLYRAAREIGRWAGAGLTVRGYLLVAGADGAVTARQVF